MRENIEKQEFTRRGSDPYKKLNVLIRESIDRFTRGADPYRKLGIGKYEDDFDFSKLKDGDKIEVQENLYYCSEKISENNLYTIEMIDDGLNLAHKKGDIIIYPDWDQSLEDLANWEPQLLKKMRG